MFTVLQRKVGCLALVLGLLGCAHEVVPNDVSTAPASSLSELKSGSVRLHCESACVLAWNTKSRHLKALHDQKLWADLVHEVRHIDHVSDLSYYYLGRAAEGLGHTEAAGTYYRLALTYLQRCDGWITGCDGFDFPRDIRVRLAGLSAVKPQAQSTPIPAPISTASPPLRRESSRMGTGFVIHSDGLVVTSLHLVDQARSITVTARGDLKSAAQLLGKNEPCDLAVLKVPLKFSNGLPIQKNPKKIKRGSEVLTVGFPRVNVQGFESKVTNGLISSLTGVANNPNFFQISVPIQPGNSGGPLVSRDGLVVGVVSSKLAIQAASSMSDVQPENVNYAVKSSCLRDLLKTLPGKYRYESKNESKKGNRSKTATKAKTKAQTQEMSMVDLTERVEKAVVLIAVSTD